MSLPWIAMTGPAQAGKDTFARFLNKLGGYQRIAFADPLKKMALAVDPYIQIAAREPDGVRRPHYIRLDQLVREVGWERAKGFPDCRRFLQRLGKDGVRDVIGEHTWICLAEEKAMADTSGAPVVFTDCRFQNELDMIRGRGGVRVHISRDFVQLDTSTAGHASENSLPVPGPNDFLIYNAGTLADLEQQAKELLTALA